MDCLYEFEAQTLFYWPLMTQTYVCLILRWRRMQRTHAQSYIYVVVDLIDLKVLNVKRFRLLSEYPIADAPQT